MYKFYFFFFFYVLSLKSYSQYAPQALVAGTTAIYKNNNSIVEWANKCTIQRGWMDIADTSLGKVTLGDSSLAVGIADGQIVSLGDSGIADLEFPNPIQNLPGADFVVFENGFANPNNAEEAFLELAFVEVSSDGVHYVRFPATSNTPTQFQIPAAGVYLNARLINNLAGKYIAGYGTPFDLQELSGNTQININRITHVRIVDVVGSISNHYSIDNNGQIINDPYPTPFPGGGFDLDAVGVINSKTSINSNFDNSVKLLIIPNPIANNFKIESNIQSKFNVTVFSLLGKKIIELNDFNKEELINCSDWQLGMYTIVITNENGERCYSFLNKQ